MAHNTYLSKEEQRIKRVAEWYNSREDFDRFLILYGSQIILSRAKGSSVLELGSADGLMTQELSKRFQKVTVVEGSRKYITALKNLNLRNVICHHTLFEDFYTEEKFDAIIMARILEHVRDPVAILKQYKDYLSKKGKIFIIVPNANALNRHIGKAMGLIKRLDELHQRDRLAGHRRVYFKDTLKRDINRAGLRVVYSQGIFLKPFSNKQMMVYSKQVLDALFIVGKKFADICSEIYVECR